MRGCAYAGRFDEGWDAYREETYARQKELGVIPADAELSRHDPDVPEWESLSPDPRKLAARLMEVFAGFLSHTDAQIGGCWTSWVTCVSSTTR
jgi:arylsulfatase A-like enzyme